MIIARREARNVRISFRPSMTLRLDPPGSRQGVPVSDPLAEDSPVSRGRHPCWGALLCSLGASGCTDHRHDTQAACPTCRRSAPSTTPARTAGATCRASPRAGRCPRRRAPGREGHPGGVRGSRDSIPARLAQALQARPPPRGAARPAASGRRPPAAATRTDRRIASRSISLHWQSVVDTG